MAARRACHASMRARLPGWLARAVKSPAGQARRTAWSRRFRTGCGAWLPGARWAVTHRRPAVVLPVKLITRSRTLAAVTAWLLGPPELAQVSRATAARERSEE